MSYNYYATHCPRVVCRYAHALRWSSTLASIPPKRKVPIPKLPPPPTSPYTYVTETEYTTHVKPLFWNRWSLKFINRNLYLKDGELCSGVFSSPHLRRVFYLNGMEHTKSFVRDMNKIVASEKHEPFVSIRTNDYGTGSFKVSVLSNTHQCHDAPSLLQEGGTRVGPGISVLDARFAILMERHFQEEYLKQGYAFDRPWKHLTIPPEVEEIKKKHLEADEKLMKRELSSYDSIVTPDLDGVTPMPVPEVPLRVDGELCTDEDFTRTISPLYTRGWYIVYNNIPKENDSGRVMIEKHPVLNGFFKFRSFDTAAQFSQDVMDLACAENMVIGVWMDAQTVTVQGVAQMQQPCVMKQDARFAVLVEEMFVAKYEDRGRRSGVRGMKLLAQPGSVEEVQRHPAGRVNERRYSNEKWMRIVRAKQRTVDRARVTGDMSHSE